MKRFITFQMERILTFFLFFLYILIVALSLVPCMIFDKKPLRYNRQIIVANEETSTNKIELFDSVANLDEGRIVAPVA